MNRYLLNLSKIEFVVTYACTGRCKHCSQGEHTAAGGAVDVKTAADAVRRISEIYPIKTVMTFGGEPLLYPETVFEIQKAALEMGIPRRQVITNGYFTKDDARIKEVAKGLSQCGVNDVLLSADAFHQETIPLEKVLAFAEALLKYNVPVRLQPAWLVRCEDDNPYNLKTREVLKEFSHLNLPVGSGNVIFPEGNAKKYLKEYFTDVIPENPYEDDPADIRCVSFEPNGNVLNANVYKTDILEILKRYAP